jgi:Na+/melibiose symporter-like transporter
VGTIAGLGLLVLAGVGWAATRYAHARDYREGWLVGIVTWCLGVVACIFLMWLVLRVDEYPVEVVPSGLGLAISVGLVWFTRARAPQPA